MQWNLMQGRVSDVPEHMHITLFTSEQIIFVKALLDNIENFQMVITLVSYNTHIPRY